MLTRRPASRCLGCTQLSQLLPEPASLLCITPTQEEVVLESGMLSNSGGAEISSAPPGGRPPLLAHRGFLARARSIPIQQLYAEARARGKRLVLTGEQLS